jgi:hypothetical protein
MDRGVPKVAWRGDKHWLHQVANSLSDAVPVGLGDRVLEDAATVTCQGVFHHRFPNRDNTQEYLIPGVLYGVTPRGGQTSIRTDKPQEHMGVK